MDTSFIKQLGLKEVNSGTWTGISSIGENETLIESYSPVDGKLIGKVGTTSRESYDEVIEKGEELIMIIEKYLNSK